MSGKDTTPTWLWIAGGMLLLAAFRKQPKSSRKALPASTGSVALPSTATTNGAKVSR